VIEISRTAAGVCLWINLVQAQNMLALHANIYKIWPLVFNVNSLTSFSLIFYKKYPIFKAPSNKSHHNHNDTR